MEKLQWKDIYHVDISPESISKLLTCEGDFLVCKSIKDNKMVVSVFWDKEVRHFKANVNTFFSFGAKAFPTFLELINYHYTKQIPLSGGESAHAILKRAKLVESKEMKKEKNSDGERKETKKDAPQEVAPPPQEQQLLSQP